MDTLLRNIRRLIPAPVFTALQPIYHWLLAVCAALVYGLPSRKLIVIGVTGTKGKSSTIELINAIFETAGYTTALASTIRMKVGERTEANRFKMTMPGRFFTQRFLRSAVHAGCEVAIIEMTSEGVKQYRHTLIFLDALVFTNLSPEHIESHGSLEAYANAKLELGRALARSPKRPRSIIANADDQYGARFLALPVERSLPFSLEQVPGYTASEHGFQFTFDTFPISSSLPGMFSLKNALAAAVLARSFGIKTPDIKRGIERVSRIPGRAETIDAGQDFLVVVDYAHTPDSLEALYDTYQDRRKICVLGATGGGRDTWKRPLFGTLAEKHCAHIILTNEDPYDEDPGKIVDDIAAQMNTKPEVIMDRRAAIRRALSVAEKGDAILITGKGTDPYIMGAHGKREPWSDASVAREELNAHLHNH